MNPLHVLALSFAGALHGTWAALLLWRWRERQRRLRGLRSLVQAVEGAGSSGDALHFRAETDHAGGDPRRN